MSTQVIARSKCVLPTGTKITVCSLRSKVFTRTALLHLFHYSYFKYAGGNHNMAMSSFTLVGIAFYYLFGSDRYISSFLKYFCRDCSTLNTMSTVFKFILVFSWVYLFIIHLHSLSFYLLFNRHLFTRISTLAVVFSCFRKSH